MIRRALVTLSAAVFFGMGALAGCTMADPCANIPPAPPALVAQAADAEIERTGDGGTDCVLTPAGDWAAETDD